MKRRMLHDLGVVELHRIPVNDTQLAGKAGPQFSQSRQAAIVHFNGGDMGTRSQQSARQAAGAGTDLEH